jgi:hypothetical protein
MKENLKFINDIYYIYKPRTEIRFCQCGECGFQEFECDLTRPKDYIDGHKKTKSKETRERMSEVWENMSEEERTLRNKKTFISGKYTSKKNNSKISFDSSYEILLYIKLEHDDNVIKYGRCNFSIPYMFEGSWHRYFPDVMVEYGNGCHSIIEPKREDFLNDPKTIEKIKIGYKYCLENNIIYEVYGLNEVKVSVGQEDLSNIEFYKESKKERFIKLYVN